MKKVKGLNDNFGKVIDVDKITVACGGNAIEGGKQAIAIIDDS